MSSTVRCSYFLYLLLVAYLPQTLECFALTNSCTLWGATRSWHNSCPQLLFQSTPHVTDNITTNTCSESSDSDYTIIQNKIEKITAIASDVDGTLLSSQHYIPEKNLQVLRRVVHHVLSSSQNNDHGHRKFFFPATGKTRRGALASLGPEARDLLLQLPGVFVQGMYCVDANGTVVFEQQLQPSTIEAAEQLASTLNITIIGTYRDTLYHNRDGDPDRIREVSEIWGEAAPLALDSLAHHPFQKLVFMHSNTVMLRGKMRPALESVALEHNASVTQAVPSILELLPRGCSKALGVQKLCEFLGVKDPSTQLLALGDAENDVEFLRMAAIGVAMGNGCPKAKAAADVVMEETNDEGAAGLAMERFSWLARE